MLGLKLNHVSKRGHWYPSVCWRPHWCPGYACGHACSRASLASLGCCMSDCSAAIYTSRSVSAARREVTSVRRDDIFSINPLLSDLKMLDRFSMFSPSFRYFSFPLGPVFNCLKGSKVTLNLPAFIILTTTKRSINSIFIFRGVLCTSVCPVTWCLQYIHHTQTTIVEVTNYVCQGCCFGIWYSPHMIRYITWNIGREGVPCYRWFYHSSDMLLICFPYTRARIRCFFNILRI